MKGSVYDREVLKKMSDNYRMTLKDLDFIKTEQRVWIDYQDAYSISHSYLIEINQIL